MISLAVAAAGWVGVSSPGDYAAVQFPPLPRHDPWRDLPEQFGKWSSVYRQFRRWTLAGLWEQILDALNESRIVPDALQMIDSTVVRAHHQAAGAKGGLRGKVSAARGS